MSWARTTNTHADQHGFDSRRRDLGAAVVSVPCFESFAEGDVTDPVAAIGSAHHRSKVRIDL